MTQLFREWEYKLPEKIIDVDGTEMECPFEGTVVLKILPGSERFKLGKSVAFKVTQSGEMALDTGTDVVEKMIKIAEENIVSINLKSKEGHEFKTLEELRYDESAFSVLLHLGGVAIKGIRLGKP